MRFQMISPDEVKKFRTDKNTLIIDLREKEVFRKEHIDGAVNIPFEMWTIYEKNLDFLNLLKKKNVILYCERGPTSFSVAKELAEKGISVSAMVGGMKAYRGKMKERY